MWPDNTKTCLAWWNSCINCRACPTGPSGTFITKICTKHSAQRKHTVHFLHNQITKLVQFSFKGNTTQKTALFCLYSKTLKPVCVCGALVWSCQVRPLSNTEWDLGAFSGLQSWTQCKLSKVPTAAQRCSLTPQTANWVWVCPSVHAFGLCCGWERSLLWVTAGHSNYTCLHGHQCSDLSQSKTTVWIRNFLMTLTRLWSYSKNYGTLTYGS